MSKIIGIDLGTTNICGAYFDPFEEGETDGILLFKGEEDSADLNSKDQLNPLIMPSVLAIQNGEVIIGHHAKNYLQNVSFVKRRIDDKRAIYETTHIEDPTPIGISALFLEKIKERAEKALGEKVSRAVITVPAHFSNRQKAATRKAGEQAGLKVEDLIPEPEAAALAYCKRYSKENATIMVYDLGGGTFDATILTVENNICKIAGYGDGLVGETQLGGHEFDRLLASYIRTKIVREMGGQELTKEQDLKILREAERLKIYICNEEAPRVGVFIPKEVLGESFEKLSSIEINIERLNSLISDHVNHTIRLCRQTFEKCKINKPDIKLDWIIMVGGSSRIPIIKTKLEKEFGITPALFNPDLCVAIGAAIYASGFGHVFESTMARIVLRPLPFDIGEEVKIKGVVKCFNQNNEEIDDLSDYKVVLLKGDSENIVDTVSIAKQNRFEFKNVIVPKLNTENHAIAILSPLKEQILKGTFSIKQGRRIKPEKPRIAQPFQIKTINGLVQLISAGAKVGITAKQTFYTAHMSDVIRIPAYEGIFPLGELQISVDETLAIGTPIEISVGYDSKDQIILSAQSSAHGIFHKENLKLKKREHEKITPEKVTQVKEDYAVLMKEINSRIEIASEETKNEYKPEVDFLRIVIDKELSSSYGKFEIIEEYILRLEYIHFGLSIPKPNAKDLEMMVAIISQLIDNLKWENKQGDLTDLINDIDSRIPALISKGKNACNNNDVKAYAEVKEEYHQIYSQLIGLQPDVTRTPQYLERLVADCESILRESIRAFEHELKINLPNQDKLEEWESLEIENLSSDTHALFERLKVAVIKMFKKKNNETSSDQSQIRDLGIIRSTRLIPLNKEIVFQFDQKDLLKL